MKRITFMASLLALLGGLVWWISPGLYQALGESAGSPVSKENLDLPFQAGGLSGEDEEAPPLIIFYGQIYETGGVFFCLDKSMSMADGEWRLLQGELVRVVNELSGSMDFGIIFFDEETDAFPSSRRPAQATAEMKSAAIQKVQATTASARSTCFLPALKEILQMARLSGVKHRSIIFMSDGKPTCVGQDTATYGQKTLQEVAALNVDRIPIHTVGIGFEVSEFFLKTLSTQSGGRYRRLAR